MRTGLWSKTLYLSFGVLVGSAMLFAGTPTTSNGSKPTAESYNSTYSKKASQILKQVQDDAYKVRDSAAQLEAEDREPAEIGWRGEANLLNRLRNQVNRMNAHISQLRALEPMIDSQQQATINRILPQMIVVRDETQSAIHFLSHNQFDLWAPRYDRDAVNLYDSANRVCNDLQHGGWEYMAARHQTSQTSKS
jgi:hypothetical protein